MALSGNPSEPEEFCHGIVGNIPVEFHSADLRSFFSHFIESNGFSCFHFRHRPEVQISTDTTTENDRTKGKSCCCVVRLPVERMNDFVKTYHGHNWVNRNKKCFAKKAVVSRIKVEGSVADEGDEPQYQTRKERKQNVSGRLEFSRADLDNLIELHPPPMMPNGNVGTPTAVFLELIRSCKLPPKIVSKLGLTFPKNHNKKYGNIPFDYDLLNRRRTRVAYSGDIEEKVDGSKDSEEPCVVDLHVERSKEITVKEEADSSSEKNSDEGETISRANLYQKKQDSITLNRTQSKSTPINRGINPKINKLWRIKDIYPRGESCSSDGSSEGRDRTLRAGQDEQVLRSVNKNSILSKSTLAKTQSKSLEKTETVATESLDLRETGEASRKQNCAKLGNKSCRQSKGQAQEDSDGEAEDWERHEALHNDVDSQGRTRERLFEEEIELKWEKGGSGLVFYTDAAFWRQQEEADMDEEMADDWDVDMGVYEDAGGGDKDSRDLLQMRTQEQWRRGNEVDPSRIGGFEKFTKGFGGRLMRQQGWKEGKGLGSSQAGRAEPVSAEGQTPHSKRGLGYFGEKLERNVQVKRARADREVKISTIYDEPDGRGVNLFQSQGPYILTYRDNVEFVPAAEVEGRQVK